MNATTNSNPLELSRRDFLSIALSTGVALTAPSAFGAPFPAAAEFTGTPRFERPPVFVKGFYEPVTVESTFDNLAVHGAIPRSLNGRYFRNGHNPPADRIKGFWFGGQGMIHGIRLSDGHAQWYRNRFVRTPALQGAELMRKDGSFDLTASAAATSVYAHAGRIYALQEVNLPFIVSPELETQGPHDFGGKLKAPMTAHPKIDRRTGEMLFISYLPVAPHLSYFRVSPDGELTHAEAVDGPGASVMHDFAITANHAVFIDPSVTLNEQSPLPFPYTWNERYQAKIGYMPRDRSKGPARFIEVDPYYIFHFTNAWEDNRGRIVFEATQYDRQSWNESARWINSLADHGPWVAKGSRLTRWTVDPASGKVATEPLAVQGAEFPTFNQTYLGRHNRFSYMAAFPNDSGGRHAIVKYDGQRDRLERHEFAAGSMPGEPWFVADPDGTGEDDGWILTLVSDLERKRGALHILDARSIATKPVAVIDIPGWIAAGVHGSWIADSELVSRDPAA